VSYNDGLSLDMSNETQAAELASGVCEMVSPLWRVDIDEESSDICPLIGNKGIALRRIARRTRGEW
jgi:hypothetical protein